MAETDHLAIDVTSGLAFPCHDGETLLTAAVRSGNQIIRVGCRAGGCGMCKVRILNGNFAVGKMSRAHVSEVEERQGYVLACRTVPSGSIEFCSRTESGLPEDGDKGVKV